MNKRRLGEAVPNEAATQPRDVCTCAGARGARPRPDGMVAWPQYACRRILHF
jgi:hypothetical protein